MAACDLWGPYAQTFVDGSVLLSLDVSLCDLF